MALVPAVDSIGVPPQAPPARPRLLLVGTTFALVGISMAFAGLLGIYLDARNLAVKEGVKFLPDNVNIELTPGNVALFGLLISSVVVQWAVYSISVNDRPRAYLALGLTALLGAAYINSICFYWGRMGITVHDRVGALIFSITGLHVAMVGAGVLFVGLMAFRTLGGEFSGRDREGLIAAAIYWHTSVAIYIVIWFAIFVTK